MELTGAGPTSVFGQGKGMVGRVEVMGKLERAVRALRVKIFDPIGKKGC